MLVARRSTVSRFGRRDANVELSIFPRGSRSANRLADRSSASSAVSFHQPRGRGRDSAAVEIFEIPVDSVRRDREISNQKRQAEAPAAKVLAGARALSFGNV